MGRALRTVHRAVRDAGTTGEPLPSIYPSLERNQVLFRRGGTSMLAGWPGSYKSTLALNLAVLWAKQGLTILYVSADSDEVTVAKRVAAMMTGDRMADIEKVIRQPGNPYLSHLRSLATVHWEFRQLNIKQLDERLVALKNMHGAFPDLVVMDNLMNMTENPTDYSGQMTMCRDLDQVARAAASHVMILHHTHENAQGKSAPPLPQAVWDIHGKVNQFPRLILTLAAATSEEVETAHLMVAPVKNTNGPADRSGRTYLDFIIDTPSAKITEIRSV